MDQLFINSILLGIISMLARDKNIEANINDDNSITITKNEQVYTLVIYEGIK